MTHEGEPDKDAMLLLQQEGEKEMPMTVCVLCENYVRKPHENDWLRSKFIEVTCKRVVEEAGQPGGAVELVGFIRCLVDGNEWPIRIRDNVIRTTDEMMPVAESPNLSLNVPADIVEDIKEAERAHFAQCYRSVVSQCRRAIQRGLISREIPDAPYSAMLEQEARMKPPLLAGC